MLFTPTTASIAARDYSPFFFAQALNCFDPSRTSKPYTSTFSKWRSNLAFLTGLTRIFMYIFIYNIDSAYKVKNTLKVHTYILMN